MPGYRIRRRRFPESVTAWRDSVVTGASGSGAAYQISLPSADQARFHQSPRVARVLTLPDRSTARIEVIPCPNPASTGDSKKATASPRGERRGVLIRPVVSYMTLPGAHSVRILV